MPKKHLFIAVFFCTLFSALGLFVSQVQAGQNPEELCTVPTNSMLQPAKSATNSAGINRLLAFNHASYSYDYSLGINPVVPSTKTQVLGVSATQSAQIVAIQTEVPEATETAIISSPTPVPTPKPTPTPSAIIEATATPQPVTPQPVAEPTTLDTWFEQYGSEYGVSPALLKAIAQCEAGLRPDAVSSTGAYHGLFQFAAATWSSNRNAMGLDPNPDLRRNAEEAIKTAAFKISKDGIGAWPHCGKKAVAG